MNKRIIDLVTKFTYVLTLIAATPDSKEILAILPWEWQPYIIKAGLFATAILSILSFKAPPTPSPTPAQAKHTEEVKDAAELKEEQSND